MVGRTLVLRFLKRHARDRAQALGLQSEVEKLCARSPQAGEIFSRGEMLRRSASASVGAVLGLGRPAAAALPHAVMLQPEMAIAGGGMTGQPDLVRMLHGLGFSELAGGAPLNAPKRLSLSGSTPVGSFRLDVAGSWVGRGIRENDALADAIRALCSNSLPGRWGRTAYTQVRDTTHGIIRGAMTRGGA